MAAPHHSKQQYLEAWLQGNTVKIALGDNSVAYTFDATAHEFVDDVFDGGVTAAEMSGTGYSRLTLDTAAGDFTQDNTDGEGVWDSSDATWTGLDAGTIQFILVYLQVGGDDTTPGDDPIIAVWDDDSAGSLADLPLTTNGSDVTVSFSAEGVVNIG